MFTLYVDDINILFFFFQAEDGIRDYKVTGVQTCALPISRRRAACAPAPLRARAAAPRPPPCETRRARRRDATPRSEEHTSELQSPCNLVCRLLLEKKKVTSTKPHDPPQVSTATDLNKTGAT